MNTFADLLCELEGGSRQKSPLKLAEGEILEAGRSGGEDRLRVLAQGLPLEKEDLRADPRLRWDWEPEEDHGQVELLRPGERVLLMTEDDQFYYLICKVVAP